MQPVKHLNLKKNVRKLLNNFWVFVARLVLRNRYIFLSVFIGITIFLALQWKYIRMTYSEANMLPKDSPISKEYDKFLSMFGEEGNLIVIGVEADKITQTEGFNRWNMLAHDYRNSHKWREYSR